MHLNSLKITLHSTHTMRGTYFKIIEHKLIDEQK